MSKAEKPISADNRSESPRNLNLGIPIPPKPVSEIPIINPEVGNLRRPSDFPLFAIREDIVKAVTKYLGIGEDRIHVIDPQKAEQGEVKTETPLEQEGRAWFQRLENGNQEALNLLKWATEMSLKEFQGVYERLGSKFEYMLGESFYIPVI